MVELPSTSGNLVVASKKLTEVGTHTVYFTNEVTIASNGPAGSSTFNLNQVSEQVSFSIAITDPCSGSTANSNVFKDSGTDATITAISVTDGNSITVNIDAPTNSFAVSESVADRCGSMSLAVYTTNDGSDTNPTNNWASVTGPDFTTGKYVLTIDTSADLNLIADESTVALTLYIKTIIVDYNTQLQYTAFTVNIDATTCDCTALLWTNPSATTQTVAVSATETPSFALPAADTTNTATNAAF